MEKVKSMKNSECWLSLVVAGLLLWSGYVEPAGTLGFTDAAKVLVSGFGASMLVYCVALKEKEEGYTHDNVSTLDGMGFACGVLAILWCAVVTLGMFVLFIIGAIDRHPGVLVNVLLSLPFVAVYLPLSIRRRMW